MDSSHPNERTIPQNVLNFCHRIGYPVRSTATQRIIGPVEGEVQPIKGSEIFIYNIPKYLTEEILFPIFAETGRIYKFRLMIIDSEYNRGNAFVTYATLDGAEKCISLLNGKVISPIWTIFVEKSKDNRRLFIGGVPEDKTKEEIWQSLQQLGITGIVDIITYKSYTDKNQNRGFAFVEFHSHQQAAEMRLYFRDSILFGQRVSIDWSTPVYDVDDEIMAQVKILFIRNLELEQNRHDLSNIMHKVLPNPKVVEKIYKNRDYAFIHFKSRKEAQRALKLLKKHFKNTTPVVEIEWAKPPPGRHVTCNKENAIANAHGLQKPQKALLPSKDLTAAEYVNYIYSNPLPLCDCQCEHTYIPNFKCDSNESNDSNYHGSLTTGTPCRTPFFDILNTHGTPGSFCMPSNTSNNFF